jgi:hypothetical protein
MARITQNQPSVVASQGRPTVADEAVRIGSGDRTSTAAHSMARIANARPAAGSPGVRRISGCSVWLLDVPGRGVTLPSGLGLGCFTLGESAYGAARGDLGDGGWMMASRRRPARASHACPGDRCSSSPGICWPFISSSCCCARQAARVTRSNCGGRCSPACAGVRPKVRRASVRGSDRGGRACPLALRSRLGGVFSWPGRGAMNPGGSAERSGSITSRGGGGAIRGRRRARPSGWEQ